LGILPHGTVISGWGLAAYLADSFKEYWGMFGWYFIAFLGLWFAFSSQLAIVDVVARQITDSLWYASQNAEAELKVIFPRRIGIDAWLST